MNGEFTQLVAASVDDPQQRANLFLMVYEELKRLARRELGARPHDQILSIGPLVHEAYLKPFPKGQASCEIRRHFLETLHAPCAGLPSSTSVPGRPNAREPAALALQQAWPMSCAAS